jgi:pyruvate dehydrogenase E1 component alpha subunit
LYYNGYEEGNKRAGNGRVLPVSIIVAGQALHAVGIGYAMRYQGEKDTSVICVMGDGATSEGDFHEALNFAGVWNVPVVFIIKNNQWAISIPREKQTSSKTLAQKSIGFDIPGIQVDGNDPLAMYAATQEALERARSDGGPTLIEAVTYRLMMHTTADDPKKYRTDEEVESWQVKDPLVRFKKYLEDKGLWDEKKEETLQAELKSEVDAGVKEFEEYTNLPEEVCFDHVFAEMTPELQEQKQDYMKRKGS